MLLITITYPRFPHFHYILSANLGLLLHGDVFMMAGQHVADTVIVYLFRGNKKKKKKKKKKNSFSYKINELW